MTDSRNILLWAGSDGSTLERSLEGLEGVQLSVARGAGEAMALLPEAEALIVSAAQINEALLARLREEGRRLSWLHLTTAGYDNVPGDKLPRGLVVTHSPGAGAGTVAEHGMCLMLAMIRRLPEALVLQRRRTWDYGLGRYLGSLQGKTLLVLGFGHIGKALARLARTFGMRVIAVSRRGLASELAEVSCTLAEAEAHLPEADFLVVAAPLTADTERWLDARRLAMLGPHSFLVNLSRGAVVDTMALCERLHQSGLAGAALDVTAPEPLPPEHPLWRAPNLIVTPHAAAAGPTPGDCAHLVALTTENARRFARGEPLLHVVHHPTAQAA